VKLNPAEIKQIINKALAEDIGSGDITSKAVIPADKIMKAKIISKASGVAAGTLVAKIVFEMVDKKVKVKARVKDGARIARGKTILEVKGPARSILTAERTALNFLQRMSGIATLTRKFVDKVKGARGQGLGARVKILATRKTAPDIRMLDKYAVVAGGGEPHRMGLYDAILIKENHIDVCGSIAKAVSLARKSAPKKQIEVEARTLKEASEAAQEKVDAILLDNMDIDTLKKAVVLIKEQNRKIKTEASGGVTLENVASIAKTGVDRISVGALTHSPKALDMSLELS